VAIVRRLYGGPVNTDTVLLVDDDESNRAVLRAACESVGLAVVEAADGTGALREVAARTPDIVLLDVSLPDVTGLEVCRRWRAAGIAIPIVMVSGLTDRAHVSLGLRAGADDYVRKPYHVQEVLALIMEHLDRARDAGPAGEQRRMEFPGMSARHSAQGHPTPGAATPARFAAATEDV
jgi:DNA-binding response OmpR family regulator